MLLPLFRILRETAGSRPVVFLPKPSTDSGTRRLALSSSRISIPLLQHGSKIFFPILSACADIKIRVDKVLNGEVVN